MSKLSELQGKSKKYTIGDIELELTPLKLDDMSLFEIDANAPVSEQMKATKTMIAKTLKEAVPDATDEEIDNIGMQHMEVLMESIMDVNGLNKGKNIKDVIASRKAQAESSGK